ncbi:MAG: endonuclease/exonuclease/phosphatase family protein [Ferruginibacter sp.]
MQIRCLFIFLSIIFFGISNSHAQDSTIKIYSWNLQDFGQTKSDEEIAFIANTLKSADIIAIQEVVAGYGGTQAVARLSEALNNMGAKWDYTTSDPTFSSSYKTERYAFIWQTSRVKKINKAWLEEIYNQEIDKEPYYATFRFGEKEFTLVNFHAITKSKQPETEIKYFKFLPAEYPLLNLMFCGDFNCPQSHTVFIPLRKMGYASALQNQKTSLKMECNDDECLASEFDNFYYNENKIGKVNAGIIPFYKSFESLKEARTISDHVPVYFEFHLL